MGDEFNWEEFLQEILNGDHDAYLDQAIARFDPETAQLTVYVTSEWAKEAIEARRSRGGPSRLALLHQGLQRRYPDRATSVRVLVDPSFMPATSEPLLEADPPTELAPREQEQKHPTRGGEPFSGDGLNPRYTFDRYVVGTSNRLAYTAAYSIAENPHGSQYNPLFIYGGVGLGKTHLLHAIGNEVRRRHPHLRVLYVSAESFTNELVEAIRLGTTTATRNRYRSIDVLLMDDIQFLQKKAATQIEFHHTFNDLHNADKQIVLASDSNPNDLTELEERVKSRFMWGMVTQIEPPEFETRVAILQRKAEDLGIAELPADVAEFIAERITTNIRELEGTLATLHRHAELQRRPLDLALAQELFRSYSQESLEPLTPDPIIQIVADYFKMRPSEIRSKRRTKRIATVRHIAMYLCRRLTGLPLIDIGQEFGGRDHSTVINACNKIEQQAARDPQLAQMLQEIIELIEEYRRGRSARRG
ncbi:MAG: chromosomal replication initiator protein DnaA [Candidatus Poribacteria bacterium]|nr:MAG: chromosomal replication initiator protein DnaA [Candidatus Poribacteria bacterium]